MKTRFVTTAVLAAGLLWGCANDPAPKSLIEAQSRLASGQSERLEASRPNLVAEAKRLETEARDAWESGDLDAADLKARMAIQRLETAGHFEARDEALGRLKAMSVSVEQISTERARIERENSALQRFRQTDLDFQRLEAELAQIRTDDQSAQAQARRALLDARKRQGEAIGAGAPTAAEPLYNEGRLMIETALEALNQSLFVESREASLQAVGRFDAAIKASKDSAVAQRRKAQSDAQAKDKRDKLGNEAREAVDNAQTARAAAIAQRMPEKDKAAYDKATFLLDLANTRLEASQFDVAKARAEEALAIFKGSQLGADSPRGKAEAAIAAAEEARAGLIGMGITDLGVTQQADYNLNLARQAMTQSDFERAQKLAEAAKKDYDGVLAFAPRLGLGGGRLPVAQGGQGFAPAAGGFGPNPFFMGQAANQSQANDPLRREVEQMLVKVQVERAEALGAEKDKACPGTFREFEALLELARQRLQENNLPQAVEFSIRASERLKKCGADPNEPGAQKAPKGNAQAQANKGPEQADKGLNAAEKREKASAEVSLTRAQRLFARATAKKTAAEKLEEPAMLIAHAQQWYERDAWTQSASFSDEAVKILEGYEKAEAQGPAKATDPKKDTDKKAPDQVVCKDHDKRLNKARITQTAAGSRVSSQDEEASFRRAITMTLSSERFAKEGRCQDADLLLTEAERIFESIARPLAAEAPASDKGAPVKVEAPAPPKEAPKTSCAALNKKIYDARLTQSVTAGRVSTKAQETRYREAAAMLDTTESLAKKGLCKEAETMLTAANATFSGIKRAPVRTATGPDKGAPPKKDGTAKDTGDKPKKTVDPAAEADALDAIGRARVLKASRDHHKTSNVFQTGDRLLTESQVLLSRGRPVEAARLAKQATFAFESLSATKDDKGAPKMEEPWKAAYQQILDSLVQRDRASDAASSQDEKAALDRGVEFMQRSQRAWDSKDYIAAQRWAKAGHEEFQSVLKMASARDKGAADKAARDKALADKDKALKDRDKALADKDKTLEDRDKALKDKDKALADKDKALQEAEARQKSLQEATEALREAEVLHARCLERDCRKRAAVPWARADKRMTQARAAMKAEDYKKARDEAKLATDELNALLAMKATFELPSNSRRVKLVGNKLQLTPRITFVPGKATITQRSAASLDELAAVIKSNLDAIERLDLTGYTDNSGNPNGNLQLSKQRAEAVRQALIDRGIPASLLHADGRGQANPIADNNTRQGREANRRVEIALTIKR